MTFDEWYENLGLSVPHGNVQKMRMAWEAALAQRPEERLKGDALYASHGYALAARVLQSDLYAKLDDRERAECDAMVRGEAPLYEQGTTQMNFSPISNTAST